MLGTVAAVLAIGAAVSSWRVLSSYSAKGFALGGIVLLLFVLRQVYQSLKGKKLTWPLTGDLAAIGGLGACTAVVITNLISVDLPTLRFVQADALALSEIEHDLGPKASVVSYVSDAEQAVSSLGNVQSIALDSLVGALVAAVVILFLVMVMIVRERKREIGIQKAIGTPNEPIMAQFTTEALTFTLLGLVVGAVIGIIAASPVTSSLVSHSGVLSGTGARGLFGAGSPVLANLTNINAQVGWPVIVECLAAAVGVAVLASAAASWMISRVRPAEVLRSM